MENSFAYRGSIDSLNSVLDRHGQQLTDAFAHVLGEHSAHFFTALRDTLPPHAYLENIEQGSAIEGIETRVRETTRPSPLERKLLGLTLSLGMFNEAFAIDLTRRVFSYMDIPFPEQTMDDLEDINLGDIRGLTNQNFVDYFINWLTRLKGGRFSETYFSSRRNVKVNKRKTREEDVAATLENGISVIGHENGNSFLLGHDYDPEMASIDTNGRLAYRRKITTYPIMIFSQQEISQQQESLSVTPEVASLYGFAHEMGHFAAYVLQRFPMHLALVIPYSKLVIPGRS